MIIENVNGEAKRVFLFGKNNEHKCYGPVECGAGYRRRIEVSKAASAVSKGELSKVMKSMSGRKKPNGLPDAAWEQQLKDEAIEQITSKITTDMQNGDMDDDFAVMQVLLTPAGNISIEKIYLEHATEAQVQEVVNFSKGLVGSKTETESLPATSGKGSSPKAKGGRSRTTSPRRSAA